MKRLKLLLTPIILTLSTLTMWSANSIQPGQVDIDPPTLIGGGFQWWIEGDDNNNASLRVQYRQEGQEQWTDGLAPTYWQGGSLGGYTRYSEFYPIPRHFAGSIVDLTEDTGYEIKLTLTDPDGIEGAEGALEKTVSFRTRAVPQAFEGGRQVEVHPDSQGMSLQEAINDLQPGDTVLLHAGTYSPPAFEAPPSPTNTGGEKAEPGNGRTLHVYPPDYKGEKQEPHFRNLIEAYVGANWDADFNYQSPKDPDLLQDVPEGKIIGVQPGDTILMHGGVYESRPFNHYHHILGMWPTGAHYFTRQGTAQQPITIKAAGDGEVIIDGDGAYRLFDMRQADHHVLDGLTIRNAFIGVDLGDEEHGMRAEGVTIQNCKIENVRRGIVGWQDAGLQVLDTTITEDAFQDQPHGTWTITTDGTEEKPITFKPFGDGPVVLEGRDTYLLFDVMAADHLIFEQLILRNAFMAIEAGGRFGQIGSTGLTVKNCRFEDNVIGIFGLEGSCRNFTILDNVITGREEGEILSGGYGVVLAGAGHSVGYNRTDRLWDHLNVLTSATPLPGQRAWSMDFFNNYCTGARDNIFEIDGMMWNVRYMRNLIGYSGSFAMSSQPTYVGPGYYYRNILYNGAMGKALRSGDINYIHNTVVGSTGIMKLAVNNVFLQEGVENGAVNRKNKPKEIIQHGRGTHHNAWRVGGETVPGNFGGSYANFAEYAQATPGEVEVDFQDFVNIPKIDFTIKVNRPPYPHELTELDFTPVEGSPVIDAAEVIPGLNTDYVGDAPDLGARERGRDAPHYGPRTEPPSAPKTAEPASRE